MPMTVEEYGMGLTYTVMKMEQQNTNSKEGVEILQNSPFEDQMLGKGQYTSKVYHLQSKIPPWLKTFAPLSALTVEEESWSAYPKSKTVIKCPFFTKCSLTIETVNKADNGCSENVHGLNKEQLAAREVEIIDIASVSKDYWSKVIGANNVDLTTFKSERTGRGPLLKGWMDSCQPVMTTYKLVMMDAPIWGIRDRLEECLITGERALFLACHKLCFAWIDEWYGMTKEQLCELERQKDSLLKKRFQKSSKVGSKRDKRKTAQDNTAMVESCK
ncbi:cytoplasmic phosphatidylinositol transfer protein 1-like isoform X2 [Ananas comosus]|nr:cytoplasmic phosphatidylinositol transfer protein 1-like isoform X2 [Ananas comosus]